MEKEKEKEKENENEKEKEKEKEVAWQKTPGYTRGKWTPFDRSS